MTEKRIFSPAYHHAVGTSGHAVKCHIISAVCVSTSYRPVFCFFLYTKTLVEIVTLNVPIKHLSISIRVGEKCDITVWPVMVYIYLFVCSVMQSHFRLFFQKFLL